MSTVSNIGLQQLLTSQLLSQQNNLAQLNQQLGTGQQHNNLTDYTPSQAVNLLNFQNAITQRQAYMGSITTVQTRLSMYDQTMTDMEQITANASTLATQNSTLDPSKIADIQATVQNYLKQFGEDLNQQIGGRYVYAGARYNTAPVKDLTTVTGVPTYPLTPTTSPALPTYDSQYGTSNSLTVNNTPPTGNFQVGNTSIKWSDLEAGTVTSVVINGVTTNLTTPVSGLATGPGLTATQLASNLSIAINQIAPQTQGAALTGLTASNSAATVNLAFSGNPVAITPDTTGASGDISWADGASGTNAETLGTTSAAAYTQDSVAIDDNFNVSYGVTSNAPGFQQVIAGLQFMNAATQTSNASTYQTYMIQAGTLLSQGLSNMQATHAGVANNINTMSSETTTQNTDINNLQSQIANIQQVDMTTVGAAITSLQTQLQASYSATASLIQESILKYL